MKTLITATILTLLALPSYAQLDDDFRQKQLDDINKADGIKSFLGVKRPIRLENGIDNHGWLYNKKLDVKLVASVHDEYQFEVANKDVGEFCSITKIAIKETENLLKLRCPLDNDYKVGLTWAETQ